MELIKCDRCGSTAEKMNKLKIFTNNGLIGTVTAKHQADVCDKCIQDIRDQFKVKA